MIDSINRKDLVGERLLDGNASDTSGEGNDGTATDVTRDDAERGFVKECGSFNGSSSKIDVADNADYEGSTFSVSIRCKISDNGGIAIAKRADGDATFWEIGTYSAGKRLFRVSADSDVKVENTLRTDTWTHLVGTYDGSDVKLYINGILDGTVSNTGSVNNSTGLSIGARSNYSGTEAWSNGDIGLTRIYNKTLTPNEIQALYIEGLRRLGQNNYPALFEGAVAIFGVDDGGQDLYNYIDGGTTTRTGGTNTTDNLGINRGITNPNYSWSSITYTHSYLREDTGSGWDLTKDDSNVTATGINKTTTMGSLYLFNRELSSGEQAELKALLSKGYPLPRSKTSTNNLQEGLVLDIDGTYSGTTYYDQSGEGNNGTASGGVSDGGRIGKHKIMSFDGSDDNINIGEKLGGYTEMSIFLWYNGDNGSTASFIDKGGDTATRCFRLGIESNGTMRVLLGNSSGWFFTDTTTVAISNNTRQLLGFTYDGSNVRYYVDGILKDTKSTSGNIGDGAVDLLIGCSYNSSEVKEKFVDGEITDTRVYDRALSAKEIEQLYYKTFILNT